MKHDQFGDIGENEDERRQRIPPTERPAPPLSVLPLFSASAEVSNTFESAHVRKIVARIVVNWGQQCKIHQQKDIELDWLGLPTKKFLALLRNDLIAIIKETGGSRTKAVDATNHLLIRPDGIVEPAISIWLLQPREAIDDSSGDTIQEALLHYVSEVFRDIAQSSMKDNSDAAKTSPSSGILLANVMSQKLLSQFTSKTTQLPLTISIGDQVFSGCSSLRSPRIGEASPAAEVHVRGQIVKWDAGDIHRITVKPIGQKMALDIGYHRNNDASGWRTLRDGLDEVTVYNMTVERQVVGGIETYTLLSALVVGDLISD